jgi:GntR family transcriptional regulator
LAQSLKLNVNTVKHAFSDLETANVIYTIVGRGSFVSEQAQENTLLKEKALAEIGTALKNGRSNGLGREEILQLVDSLFSGE